MDDYLQWDEWEESSDEEDAVRGQVRREYRMRERITMDSHDDVDFFRRYRFRKDTAASILELLRPDLEFDEPR